MIPPRTDLDDEHTRLLTYTQAHVASVEHRDAVASIAADISGTVVGTPRAGATDGVEDQFTDEDASEMSYRAALATLSSVVQRSLRDFVA